MRIPDIVTKVFRDRGFTDFDNALAQYRTLLEQNDGSADPAAGGAT